MYYEEEDNDFIDLSMLEIAKAYENTYLIITKESTVSDIVVNSGTAIFIFNPEDPESAMDFIDDVLEYYQDQEDYEKCAVLHKIKNGDDS